MHFLHVIQQWMHSIEMMDHKQDGIWFGSSVTLLWDEMGFRTEITPTGFTLSSVTASAWRHVSSSVRMQA